MSSVPHIIVMLFSNFFLRKIGPRTLFASSVFLWGIIVTFEGKWGQVLHPELEFDQNHSPGFITTYRELIVCRILLGITEGMHRIILRFWFYFHVASISGPFASAVVLYLSEFYKRHSLQKRISILLCAWSLGGATAGILMSGILRLHGKGGKPGWRCVN